MSLISSFFARDIFVIGDLGYSGELDATADQTPAELLAAIQTVDGAASGLDSDLLDGQEGAFYLDYNNLTSVPATATPDTGLTQDITGGMFTSNTESGIATVYNTTARTIELNVNDPLITIAGEVEGSATMTDLADTTITVALSAAKNAEIAGKEPAITKLTGFNLDLGVTAGTVLEGNALDNHYTKAEVDAKDVALVTGIDWKESVSTFADLDTTYPTPVEGWSVSVNAEDTIYRYDGIAWVKLANGVTPLASATIDGKMSMAHWSKLEAIEAGANLYVHAVHTAQTVAMDSTLLSGATIVSQVTVDITTDAEGHTTAAAATVATRELTMADLGAYQELRQYSNAALTLVADGNYLLDTATAGFIATLPTAPADFTVVRVNDVSGTFDVNNVTLAPGGTDTIFNLAENLLLDLKNKAYIFTYYAGNWSVTV